MRSLVAVLIFLLPLSSFSEEIYIDDLILRYDLYYKEFTDVPFTGEVTGNTEGKFISGKKEGKWKKYFDNGQLIYIGNYKKGKKEGIWARYHKNGQLGTKGNYKSGKREGEWISYFDNGQIFTTGYMIEGKPDGKMISYQYDGILENTKIYRNGKLIDTILPKN